MVPLIRRELVERRKWMANEEFIDALAVAQSAPGPIAINTSVICGYKIAGVPGALTATAGSSLPSFIIILFVAVFVLRFKNSTLIPAVFKGMRPAIFGILAAAVWQVGKTTIRRKRDLAFFAAGAFLLLALNAHPILVVVVAATGGLLYERFPAMSRFFSKRRGIPGHENGARATESAPASHEKTSQTGTRGGETPAGAREPGADALAADPPGVREALAEGSPQGKKRVAESCDVRPPKQTDTRETAENGSDMA